MIKHSKTPLILVDGSSYLYRAFHAMPSLQNSKGLPTGAVYGVVNMLRSLISEYHPEWMAVIFDAKGKTFRDELYAEYKATRPSMPEELVKQIEPLHQVIQALGIPLLMIEGVEADDVIGTLAHQANEQGISTLISTGDKDLAQLVNDKITLVNTMSETILNPNTVKEKFGVPPSLIIDYLALIGDTSDNIPGIPQVGPKTAAKWLTQYGSLDEIIKHADQISGKVGESFRTNLSLLPLSKTLVTIKKDVTLPVTLEDLHLQSQDKNTLTTLYKELEFKNWLAELLSARSLKEDEQKYAKYETILTEQALHSWVEQLSHASLCSFDTETTSLDALSAKLVGVSFAMEVGKAAYIPFGHDYLDAPIQLSKEYVLQKIKPFLENESLKKIGHHIKYDMEVLAQHGVTLRGITFDSMLESYVLDSASNNHDMDSLAL